MKKIFLVALAIVVVTNVWGQNKFADPYMTDEQRPNGLKWLPDPPKLTGADFTYDFYYYQWGRDQREDKKVSEQALFDERAPLDSVYERILKIDLGKETAPEIYLLCERAVSDVHAANKEVKNVWQRTRPFAQFKEPSLKPWEDEEEASTFSYPSGHSSRGWMYAFVLSTVAPEFAEELFARARSYALNRVICGHHWKSDVDASLMLAAGIFAAIVCTDAYQQQLVKARAEYEQIRKGMTNVPKATIVQHPAGTPAYTINGTPATESSRGIIIQNGQKTLRK
jgi:acid phosphatase (class A)